MSLILMERNDTHFSVLDTSDGVVEQIERQSLLKFLRDNPSIRVDGIFYNAGNDKFTSSVKDYNIEVTDDYCLVFVVTNKGTLRVGVDYTIYKLGTGEQIATGYITGAKSDYIRATVDRFIDDGVECCFVNFEYYDKHYFREDIGIELNYIIEYRKCQDNTFTKGRELQWVERTYVYQDRSGKIIISG